jgi:hypothetical protein
LELLKVMTIGINVVQRIVVRIAVLVEGLGVGDVGVGEGAGRERVARAEGVHRAAGACPIEYSIMELLGA